MKEDQISIARSIIEFKDYREVHAIAQLFIDYDGKMFHCKVCRRVLKTRKGIYKHMRDKHQDYVEKEMERLKLGAEHLLSENKKKHQP